MDSPSAVDEAGCAGSAVQEAIRRGTAEEPLDQLIEATATKATGEVMERHRGPLEIASFPASS